MPRLDIRPDAVVADDDVGHQYTLTDIHNAEAAIARSVAALDIDTEWPLTVSVVPDTAGDRGGVP